MKEGKFNNNYPTATPLLQRYKNGQKAIGQDTGNGSELSSVKQKCGKWMTKFGIKFETEATTSSAV